MNVARPSSRGTVALLMCPAIVGTLEDLSLLVTSMGPPFIFVDIQLGG